MRAHTRKHPTNVSRQEGRSHHNTDKPIPWREAFKDVLEKLPEPAVALQGFRNRENLTQKQLAESLGMNQANISKMENGKRSIGKNIAKKLATFFKTDYRVFL
jgi:DNA-binding XRE family transcriptional regulator